MLAGYDLRTLQLALPRSNDGAEGCKFSCFRNTTTLNCFRLESILIRPNDQ